jgi:hypothetical protein
LLARIWRRLAALLVRERAECTATCLGLALTRIAEGRSVIPTSTRKVRPRASTFELLPVPTLRIGRSIALPTGFPLLVQQLLQVVAAIALFVSTLSVQLAAERLLSLGL